MLAFIGTPLADTVRAGAGPIQAAEGMGHFGVGRTRAVYGQRVRVQQLGEAARRALPEGVRDVVLVPWDYAADCSPVPWSRSARWIPDTASGLFRVSVRPRADWADGLPTFDVFTTHMQPYRDAVGDRGPRGPFGDPLSSRRLSAEALLRFYDLLPASRQTPDSIAALVFARRLREDTALFGRYPVDHFYEQARSVVNGMRQLAVRIPIAGTFRVEVTPDTGPTRALFLRTSTRVSSLQHRMRGEPDTTLVPPLPEGYYVATAASPTLARLPTTCNVLDGSVQAYLDLDWHAPIPPDGTGEWRGGIDERLFEGMLSPEELRARRQGAMDRIRARMESLGREVDSLRARGDSAGAKARSQTFVFVPNRPLRVVQDASGPMRIEGTIVIDGFGPLRIRGERISRETLQCHH